MKKKLIAILAVLLTVAVFYGIDALIAAQYRLQVIDIAPQPAYADGKTPVNITVQLKKGDAAVSDHILYMLPGKGNVENSPAEDRCRRAGTVCLLSLPGFRFH